MLRRVVRETLRRAGFVVIEDADGTAGLEILQSAARSTSCSPTSRWRVNGYQLAESGLSPPDRRDADDRYADEAIPETIRQASIPILRKPFNFDTLASSVQQVIALR